MTDPETPREKAERLWKAAGYAYAADAAAADAAYAAAAAAAADADAARSTEYGWQLDRLVVWFSDQEPEDWPLPEVSSV